MDYVRNATVYLYSSLTNWPSLFGGWWIGGILPSYGEKGGTSMPDFLLAMIDWKPYDIIPDVFREKLVFYLVVASVCLILVVWLVFSLIQLTGVIANGFVRTVWSWIRFVVPYVFVWIAGEIFKFYYMEDLYELYHKFREK